MRLASCLLSAMVGLFVASVAMAQQAGTPEEARLLSDKAAAHVKDVGADQAMADFNNPTGGYQYDGLFVVVYDHDGKTLCAPGVPALVNHDAKSLKDADGVEFGKALLSAPSGSWVNYRMTNPAVKKIEKKTSYVNQVGDLTVFVGAYIH